MGAGGDGGEVALGDVWYVAVAVVGGGGGAGGVRVSFG